MPAHLWLHYTPYKYIQGSKLRLIQLQKQLSFSVLCTKNSQSTFNIYSVSNKALRCLSSCHCGVVSNALNRIMQKYAIVHDFKPINFTKLHFDELSDTILYCLNKNMHKGICMKFQLTQILCKHIVSKNNFPKMYNYFHFVKSLVLSNELIIVELPP